MEEYTKHLNELHKQDREVLFENEKFILGVLQAVSAAIIAGALSQFKNIIEASSLLTAKLLITFSVLSLILAVFSAFAKHQYKMWDVKRRDKFQLWLQLMRLSMLLSTTLLCLGLLVFVIGLWC